MSHATPVRSPCVNICALDDDDVCLGCYRTSEEITRWGIMTNDERGAVMKKVGERERSAMNFISISK